VGQAAGGGERGGGGGGGGGQKKRRKREEKEGAEQTDGRTDSKVVMDRIPNLGIRIPTNLLHI
jgi:hypothetical protein